MINKLLCTLITWSYKYTLPQVRRWWLGEWKLNEWLPWDESTEDADYEEMLANTWAENEYRLEILQTTNDVYVDVYCSCK